LKNKGIVIACLMVLSIFVLCISGPSEGFYRKSTDGPLLTPAPEVSHSPPPVHAADPTQKPTPEPGREEEDPFLYERVVTRTPDGPVVAHYLELDMKSDRVGVKPITSHRTLFGFEYMSVMASKANALAAVNGGFCYPNGLPGGMFYSNKTLKIPASGRFPVLFLLEDAAVLSDAEQRIWVESAGSSLEPVYYNRYSTEGGIYAFTPMYGSTDRIEKPHLSVVVRNGRADELVDSDNPTAIPGEGFVISAIGDKARKRLKDFITIGADVKIKSELNTKVPLPGEYLSAYECGSWLIRDGADVCPENDPWAGGMRSRAPRTAVGIKSDGTLVFIVVDGRLEDESIGVTGPELVRLMLDRGVVSAALLDGGASSEMIIGGEIVNKPSAGRERLLFSCFVVFRK
jgi:hypothetical protein